MLSTIGMSRNLVQTSPCSESWPILCMTCQCFSVSVLSSTWDSTLFHKRLWGKICTCQKTQGCAPTCSICVSAIHVGTSLGFKEITTLRYIIMTLFFFRSQPYMVTTTRMQIVVTSLLDAGHQLNVKLWQWMLWKRNSEFCCHGEDLLLQIFMELIRKALCWSKYVLESGGSIESMRESMRRMPITLAPYQFIALSLVCAYS